MFCWPVWMPKRIGCVAMIGPPLLTRSGSSVAASFGARRSEVNPRRVSPRRAGGLGGTSQHPLVAVQPGGDVGEHARHRLTPDATACEQRAADAVGARLGLVRAGSAPQPEPRTV